MAGLTSEIRSGTGLPFGLGMATIHRNGSHFAAVALVCYVATFAVAGNGCWLDVAAAVGGCAAGAWVLFLGVIRSSAGAGRFEAARRAGAATGAFLLAGATINLTLFLVAGIETFRARLFALLFVPFHVGLLLLADALAGAVFTGAAGRLGVRRRTAVGLWLFAFNLPFAGALALLRQAGVV